MKIFGAFAVAAAAVALTGCAAMFHGTSQQVHIRSTVPGTEIYVNEALIGKDFGVTTFKKSENYTIFARKAGCTEAAVSASKSFDPLTLLGILLDYGIFTILIIDGAATGAWQQFDQTAYIIDPRCSDQPAPVSAPS